MLSLVFAVAALALFGVSYFLIRKASAYSRTGGDAYVRKQKGKVIGITLLFPAMVLTLLAVGIYVGSRPASLPPPEAIAAEPYVPPVLPRPSADELLARREAPMKFSTSGEAAQRRAPGAIPSLSIQTLSSTSADPAARAPDPDLPPAPASPPSPPSDLTPDETTENDVDKLNALLQADPNNASIYGDLGNAYAARQEWTQAETNFAKSLALDKTNSAVKYDLAQVQFAQKKYDAARTGFVALEKDMKVGDLAAYKIFLCDLYGGNEVAATKELDAFDQAGENASYYFANVAWSLYHQKPDDAQDWLASAGRIYDPKKIALYTADLFKLGYLPIPSAP